MLWKRLSGGLLAFIYGMVASQKQAENQIPCGTAQIQADCFSSGAREVARAGFAESGNFPRETIPATKPATKTTDAHPAKREHWRQLQSISQPWFL